MARNNHMVVANRIGKEIVGLLRICKLYHLLRTAQVWLCLALLQRGFCCEMARQVATHFEYGDRSLSHVAADANANTAFEMSVELVSLHHVQRNGTVCYEHFATFRIDA